MKRLLGGILVLGMILAVEVSAQEVAGVMVPDSVDVQGTSLQLNGAGVRSKFFFKIYVGSLYLSKRVKTAQDAYAQSDAWRVSMHFLYDELSKEKLVAAWNEGFENNTAEEELSVLTPKIEAFNNLFDTVKQGDVINLDYKNGTGITVTMNDKVLGKVEGDKLSQAVLRIWLGETPADDSLKEAMLGEIYE